jgi:excinuclease ABC subunit A
MRRADWLVDVGPDAAKRGGRVLYSGPPEGCATVANRNRALPLRRRHGARARRAPAGLARVRVTAQQPARLDAAFRSACFTR